MKSEIPTFRVLGAIIVAFLLPGVLVAVLMPLLASTTLWNAGDLEIGVSDFALMTAGMSFLGAVMGSPAIFAGLLVWKLLSRFQLIQHWTLTFTGIACGAAVGLLFTAESAFRLWEYIPVFSAAGALTEFLFG